MWSSKLRVEILIALMAAPGCVSDRSLDGEESTSGGTIDGCRDGEAVRIFDDAGLDTGFVRCPDGRVNRVEVVSCDAGGECQSDADCGLGAVCICAAGDVFELPSLYNQAGSCAPAGCYDGGSCASGECGLAPTDDGACGSQPALLCRAYEDVCAGPNSCENNTCGILASSYECTFFGCAGRPLLDAEYTPILAAALPREDWFAEAGRVATTTVSPKQRAQLAAYWEDCALGEHASVASFARFALDLSALGAPADLLARTAQAMADEVEHARLCFGLARRFGGEARGPGKLDVQAAPMSHARRAVLSRLIAEACIGETLAVAEAAAALELSEDAQVIEALEIIVRDEMRHSGLAWASLRWAISNADWAERHWIENTLRHAVAQQRVALSGECGQAAEEDGSSLAAFGCLGSRELASARAAALRDVVEPAVHALLGGAAIRRDPLLVSRA